MPLIYLPITLSTENQQMNDKIFIDTNLWIYLYSKNEKADIVKELISANFENIIVSTQVLTELYNVLTKKKLKSKTESKEIVSEIIENFFIFLVDTEIVKKAIEISITYGYSYYDSQIITTAFQNNCKYLYSEDLQHDQVIEKQLKIINPYQK